MAFGKRTLFVAPTTDLVYAAEEADSVINTLSANQLSGNVTVSDLLERVRAYQPALLIISSHGYKEGIQLSDGKVNAGSLKSIITTSPLECVYLNTCESLETALRIHAEIPISFVSTIREVPDRMAFVTMATFVHHLSMGESYINAWYLSKGAGDRNFIYLHDVGRSKGFVSTVDISTDPPETDSDGAVKDADAELMRLGYLIYGNEKWNIKGILPVLGKLEKDIVFMRGVLMILVVLTLLLALGMIWHLLT